MPEAAAVQAEVDVADHVDEVADCRDSPAVDEEARVNMEGEVVGLTEAGNGIAAGRCSVGYSEPSADARRE